MFLEVRQCQWNNEPFTIKGTLGHVNYFECNNYEHGRSRAQTFVMEEVPKHTEYYNDKYFTVHTPLVKSPICNESSGVVTTVYLDGTITIDEVSNFDIDALVVE